ncbi:Histone methylation DOT1 family protein [Gloeothece citriformis PCC 7424]|uniref:Histone methylation DOT1 family protein n=1 Tax=Gloeothece citriformis (strain PCC 7424) TaxID=65393 RepID=B7KF93_GLOC7|nr:class I SAM-dependent methyltransferase [Gloeothece citriformis]ACK71809.1 Histone methylation DOT1 family protein [Gloeothece citriformis PCC 7424]
MRFVFYWGLSLIIATNLVNLGLTGKAKSGEFKTQQTSTLEAQLIPKDAPYVSSSNVVVEEMLRLANVTSSDVVYDLGSGDGRIVISAAQKYGARGVGIEIEPKLIQQAQENARKAGVNHLVEFRQQNFFESDISDATVVTLFLVPRTNLKLRPKLLKELKPGTRVLSHGFDMGNWKPEQVIQVTGGSKIYYWVVPEEIPEDLLNNS